MEVILKTLSGGVTSLGRITEILYNMICGNGISTKASIGKGTVFFHHGVGCVVHEKAVVGCNCKIFSNVTIGVRWTEGKNDLQLPVIGNNVLIGAGAVILGNIEIGDNAVIGANAVVLKSVPANAMAIGVPARIKKMELDT